MLIHEAAKLVGCTQRAIKFYEEKGLLPAVSRSANGYREYTDEDVRLLHEIHAYRKLGIAIKDIGELLSEHNSSKLQDVLSKKKAEAHALQHEIKALEAFIQSPDAPLLNASIDFQTISQAMHTQLPGIFGRYLASHFEPFLQIRITSAQQKDAYERILAFWDTPKIRLPLLYRITLLFSRSAPRIDAAQMDAAISAMLSPSEESYARIREQTLRIVRMRENPLIHYNPVEIMKRRMMRSLRDCGYYDIFIPQMKLLSPSYQAYQDALTSLNDRLCADLGLYYDSDFNLRLSKIRTTS